MKDQFCSTNYKDEGDTCMCRIYADGKKKEHMSLLEEGKEEDLCDSNKEMIEKCFYYLAYEDEKTKIAEGVRAGYNSKLKYVFYVFPFGNEVMV